jgi:hypothetical protein
VDRRASRPWLLGAAAIAAAIVTLVLVAGDPEPSALHTEGPASETAEDGARVEPDDARGLGGLPRTVEGWIDRLLAAKSPEDVAEARRRILGFGPAAAPALLLAMRPSRAGREKVAALYGSLEYASVEECVALLRGGTVDVACIALEAMGARGKAAAPALAEVMAGDDPWTAGPAAVALWRVTGDASPSVARFRAALESRDLDDMRSEREGILVERLAGLGPAAAPLVPALVRLLDHPDLWFEAMQAISRIGPEAVAAVPRLVRWVREEHARGEGYYTGPPQRLAFAGAECLARLGDAGLDALEQLLLDPMVSPAQGTVDAWSRAEPSVAESRLVPRLSSTDPLVRLRAALALGAHSSSLADDSLARVAPLLVDSDARVRIAAHRVAFEAIADERGVPVLRPALLAGLRDARADVRIASLRVLTLLVRDPAVVTEIVASLRDGDLAVRRAAASALDYAPLDAATRRLVDDVNGVRTSEWTATDRLERLASKGTLSSDDLATLQASLDGDDPDAVSAAIAVVASHGVSTPEVLASLEKRAREPTVVGVDAIAALGVVTGDRRRAVADLRHWLVVAREESLERGWRAFHALDRMPRGTPDVREAMQEAADARDVPRALRAEAERWLSKSPAAPAERPSPGPSREHDER